MSVPSVFFFEGYSTCGPRWEGQDKKQQHCFWQSWKQKCISLPRCLPSPASSPGPAPSFWHCIMVVMGREKRLPLLSFRVLGCLGQCIFNHWMALEVGRSPPCLGYLSCFSCWNGILCTDLPLFEVLFPGAGRKLLPDVWWDGRDGDAPPRPGT